MKKRLLGCIWLNKPKPETSDKKEILPPGSMTLHTLYVHQARAGEFLRFLKNTAANVMLETGSPEIFVDVVSKAASRSLQNAGFRNIN